MKNEIKINDFEQIDSDQLIWYIDNSKNFYVYEIKNDDEVVDILVKIENEKDEIYN